jgi:hypothetical protein
MAAFTFLPPLLPPAAFLSLSSLLQVFRGHFASINESGDAEVRKALSVALEAAPEFRAVRLILGTEILVVARTSLSYFRGVRARRRRDEPGAQKQRRGAQQRPSEFHFHIGPLILLSMCRSCG